MELVDASATNADERERASDQGAPTEIRGTVLDVIRQLLPAFDGREQILGIVESVLRRNAELERQLAKQLQTRKSEGVTLNQLMLALGNLGIETTAASGEGFQAPDLDDADKKLRDASEVDKKRDETEPPKPPKAPSRRSRPPEGLRRFENTIRVPEAERACPICGGERACIGHDVTEVIDLIPAEVIVRIDRREKLACEPCDQIVRAPLGDKAVEGGLFGLNFVAQLLIDKYCDGLPLHRQRERLARLGYEISISTLADQVAWSTDLLKPLWRAAIEDIIVAEIMHVDSTGLPVLDREVKGKTRLGSLWGYVGVRDQVSTAAYVYTSTGKAVGQKSGELGPRDILARREGPTVADASNVFEASFNRPTLLECGCNMHSRRYFIKALDAGDQRAALAIAAYKKIYTVEAEIRELDAESKYRERQKRSKPVFDELVAWCRAREPHEPPSSKLGVAIHYLLNHQLALGRFLDSGIIPIDNGAVERLHIRCALTRKNFLFAGSDAGGERAAIAFTILGSCRLVGIDPFEYLADILPILARPIRLADVPDLLPANWKARRDARASAVG